MAAWTGSGVGVRQEGGMENAACWSRQDSLPRGAWEWLEDGSTETQADRQTAAFFLEPSVAREPLEEQRA